MRQPMPEQDPKDDVPELDAADTAATVTDGNRDSGMWPKGDHYEALNPVGNEDHYEELNDVPPATPEERAEMHAEQKAKVEKADAAKAAELHRMIMEEPSEQSPDAARDLTGDFAKDAKRAEHKRVVEQLAAEEAMEDLASVTDAEIDKAVEGLEPASERAAVASAKADLKKMTSADIDKAVDALKPFEGMSEQGKAVAMRTEIARLDAAAKTVKDGPKGWQTLEDAIKVKYSVDMNKQSTKGIVGKIGVFFRKLFDKDFREVTSNYKAQVDNYNRIMEERNIMDLQVNDPEAFKKKMSGRMTRRISSAKGGSNGPMGVGRKGPQ
jgi:hypothetical protein